jgi:hypothetical protein
MALLRASIENLRDGKGRFPWKTIAVIMPEKPRGYH